MLPPKYSTISVLPGETTKQMLLTPASIIRSTRYARTARGFSTWPSQRLPTGSSSLETARGWRRLPAPAAGITAHIEQSSFREKRRIIEKGRRRSQRRDAGLGHLNWIRK